ncbi:class I SAM-dependent methyltransferase [Veillonella parvula]|uniref:tRNA (adenine(22)-N(1))-methyltransferase n=1 Tax=Veillonella parvula TaxID=29466 RepID=UPI0028FE227C|nr:class I SAM-dependent methyltransferase [Veillonella parvula]MDU3191219.1 class I SAM-dependent methyltransferase [Veillonella parvula]
MEPRPMMDRLEAVFSIVPKAHAIADIGTDHGYLAVELINRQRAEYVIAGDVHKGPLESARSGFLMRDIVDAGPEPLEFYVLQPQNGQKELRQYMVQKGYVIVLEIIVEDAGKLYTAFLAVRNDCVEAYTGMTEYVDIYQSLPEDSLLWSVGALLEQDRPPLWMKYIEYLIYQRQCVLDDMTEKLNHTDKYQDLEQEVNFLRNLLENK